LNASSTEGPAAAIGLGAESASTRVERKASGSVSRRVSHSSGSAVPEQEEDEDRVQSEGEKVDDECDCVSDSRRFFETGLEGDGSWG
jgi:hypothetical protein